MLFFFSPEKFGFYPRCPLYMLTGWKCAGCGTTRALYHLLHGEFVRALELNPFLPVIVVFFAGMVFSRRLSYSVWWIGGFFLLSFVVAILRNVYGF